jgi:hypothetical protein
MNQTIPMRPFAAPQTARSGRATAVTRLVCMAAALAALTGCATRNPPDLSAYRQSRPQSLLVLPPVNDSTDLLGSPAVMAQAVAPLAELGYYVFPVNLVQESFRENGLTMPQDIQDVSTQKLRQIFGADAAVYIKVKQYGTKYNIVASESRVTVEARIVDLRSSQQIWAGEATASSAESDSSSQGGLAGLLIKALVNQIVGQVSDASFTYAAIANQRLFGMPKFGIPAGPRSPSFQKD